MELFGRKFLFTPIIYSLLFSLLYFVYTSSPHSTISDSLWSIHLSSSLLAEGNLDLNEFPQQIADFKQYATVQSPLDGQVLSRFPIGGPLLTTPLVWLFAQFSSAPSDGQAFHDFLIATHAADPAIIQFQLMIAATTIALAALFVLAIARTQLEWIPALIVVALFAFGMSTYSVGTRALWQHTPSLLLLAVALWSLLKADDNLNWLFLTGFALGFAFVTRPTNSISVVMFGIYILLRHRWHVWRFIVGGGVVACFFILYNLNTYGALLPTYFNARRLKTDIATFKIAIFGNLFSPARGVLVFSPFLIFVLWQHLRYPRCSSNRALARTLWVIIVLHLLVISNFKPWAGGSGFGPRFFTDLTPFFAYLSIPLFTGNVIEQFQQGTSWHKLGRLLFLVAIGVSVVIHFRGATVPQTWFWNSFPVDTGIAPARYFSWEDPPFMRRAESLPLQPSRNFVTVMAKHAHVPELADISFTNYFGEPLHWRLELPFDVYVSNNRSEYDFIVTDENKRWLQSKQPLLPREAIILNLKFSDQVQINGLMSVMELTVRPVDSEQFERVIIPIAWVDTEKKQAQNFRHGRWGPLDITVGGGLQQAQFFGLHGSGWFVREQAGEFSWRWAQSPADLFVYTVSSCQTMLTLALTEIHDPQADRGLGEQGVLLIRQGGEVIEQSVTKGMPVTVLLQLEHGWNKVSLELASGNFRPNQYDPTVADRRTLSFVVPSIDLAPCE